jgi:hypothetical protein
MAEYVVPWIGIGALVALGMGISRTDAKVTTVELNSRNGPPFYDCAGAQQMRYQGSGHFAARLAAEPPNRNGPRMTGEDAYRAEILVREESERARLKAWDAATNHSSHIIVQPNSRKPTFVNNW